MLTNWNLSKNLEEKIFNQLIVIRLIYSHLYFSLYAAKLKKAN